MNKLQMLLVFTILLLISCSCDDGSTTEQLGDDDNSELDDNAEDIADSKLRCSDNCKLEEYLDGNWVLKEDCCEQDDICDAWDSTVCESDDLGTRCVTYWADGDEDMGTCSEWRSTMSCEDFHTRKQVPNLPECGCEEKISECGTAMVAGETSRLCLAGECMLMPWNVECFFGQYRCHPDNPAVSQYCNEQGEWYNLCDCSGETESWIGCKDEDCLEGQLCDPTLYKNYPCVKDETKCVDGLISLSCNENLQFEIEHFCGVDTDGVQTYCTDGSCVPFVVE